MCFMMSRLLSLVLGGACIVVCLPGKSVSAEFSLAWIEDYRICVQSAEGSGMTRPEARSHCAGVLPIAARGDADDSALWLDEALLSLEEAGKSHCSPLEGFFLPGSTEE